VGKSVTVRLDAELLRELKEAFPETQKLTFTSTVDVLLRRILKGSGKID
jgi:hypothetical protein